MQKKTLTNLLDKIYFCGTRSIILFVLSKYIWIPPHKLLYVFYSLLSTASTRLLLCLCVCLCGRGVGVMTWFWGCLKFKKQSSRLKMVANHNKLTVFYVFCIVNVMYSLRQGVLCRDKSISVSKVYKRIIKCRVYHKVYHKSV